MDVYKSNIQYDGSINKLKLIIVVMVDFQDKDMIGDTWDPTASMITLTENSKEQCQENHV